MERNGKPSKKVNINTDNNVEMRMSDILTNENEEEEPIDFGIEPTERLKSYRKDAPTAPRNLPRKRNKCCMIL